jgi:hypothetical protein
VKVTTRGVELGGTGRSDAAGFSDGATGVSQRMVGERADRWGPCVSEGRERRRRGWKARIKEENVFCSIRQSRVWAKWDDKGNGGLWKRRASAVKLSRLGRIPRGNSKEKYIFEFQRLLKFFKSLRISTRRFRP